MFVRKLTGDEPDCARDPSRARPVAATAAGSSEGVGDDGSMFGDMAGCGITVGRRRCRPAGRAYGSRA